MPPKLIVEILGDSSSLEKSFARSTQSTKKFDHELQGALRGTISATGAFHSLGRSIAFASGGFVAFAGAGEFLKSSIDAARSAEVGQKSLAAQLKASGQSFVLAKNQIDAAELSVEKFGFTTEDSAEALTVLERATGNISKAISLQGVVADLARAKNLSLAAAAGIVGKVFSGQTTALRRAVPGLDANAKGLDLIREAGEKLAGQATANTTQSQKFAASLHDTEVILGEGLLPALNSVLAELGAYLDNLNRTGKLQKDVNVAVDDATSAFKALKEIVSPLAEAFTDVGKVTGGTKNEIELLAAAFLTLEARAKLIKWGLIETGIAGVGSSAVVAEGEVAGLSGSLAGLSKFSSIVIPIAVAFEIQKHDRGLTDQFNDLVHNLGKDLHADVPSGKDLLSTLIGDPGRAGLLGNKIWNAFGVTAEPGGEKAGKAFFAGVISAIEAAATQGSLAAIFDPIANALEQVKAAVTQFGPKGTALLTPFQQNTLSLSMAGTTSSSADDLKALTDRRVLLEKKIAAETARLKGATSAKEAKKFADALQGLQDQDAQAISQIQAIQNAAPKGITADQRNTFFDNRISRLLDQVQDITSIQGQIKQLQAIGKLITARIAATKDVTRRLTLESTLNDEVLRPIAADKAQLAQNADDLFDSAISRALDRVQDIPTIQGQIRKLQQLGKQITDRIKATTDVVRQRALEDQLLSEVTRPLKADRQQLAQNFLDALQFNVDKAGATVGLSDDLIALAKQKAGILKEIKLQGDTAALEGDLLTVTENITAKKSDVFQNVLGWLDLRLSKAEGTASQLDDLAVLAKEQKDIKAQIKKSGDTLELENDLSDVSQKILAARQQQNKNRIDSRNAAQFKLIGLTATGGQITPGVDALKRELGSITDLVSGTFLDTTKTQSVLSNVAKVLSQGIKKVGQPVRDAIKGILDDFKNQLGDAQPLFKKLGRQNIFAGLGLDRETENLIKQRLSLSGSGKVPTISSPAFANSGTSSRSGGTTINIEHFHSSAPNVRQIENELTKKAKNRPLVRRGA